MSGLEVLAVVACVAGVVSAYHDGTGLIKRIKDKRASRRALEEAKATALEGSLALGPLIVQGQYDQDYRRWGERYSLGDQIARESLKDIIIHLQSELLKNLQHAWQDDVEIDFRTLQVVSDDSRVKAVLTLCQLYQRLSIEGPIAPTLPLPQLPQLVPVQGTPQPFRRVNTVSTIGSVSPIPTPPRLSYVSSTSTGSLNGPTTPDTSMDESRPNPSPFQTATSPGGRTKSGSSISIKGLFGRRPRQDTNGSDERRSSAVSEKERRESQINALFPGSTIASSQKAPLSCHLQPPIHKAASVHSNDWLLKETDLQRPHPDQVSIASSDQASNADSYLYDGPDDVTANPWIDRNSTEVSTIARRPTSNLEVVPLREIRPVAVRRVTSTQLYLPCEENKFAGFCKGAWKLQIGMKKAMSPEYRPSGMYGQIPYWRCQKCSFEGPMFGKDKASRCFDDRIRESNGIRYRWIFLAKSHTFTRSVARCADGSFGTFGCIFCCAELSKVPPMFGNVESLMNHLQMHRTRPPTGELLYRTNCIVGRVAGFDETFDINLLSPIHEVPA